MYYFDLVNLILDEITEIKDAVPQVVDGTTYGRMHIYAIESLLAKLYLNSEVYTGVSRWDETIEACDRVINAGLYRLEDDYFRNFSVDNHLSSEIIFAVPFDNVESFFELFLQYHSVLHQRYVVQEHVMSMQVDQLQDKSQSP